MTVPTLGNDGRTGEYPVGGVTTQPTVRWRYSTAAPVVGGLAIADDTLYFGDGAGAVHAVDARTGAAVWQTEPLADPDVDDDDGDPFIKTAPVVIGDRVIVEDATYAGVVKIYDRLTGAVRELDDDGCPALLGDTLLICGLNEVVAFDAATLHERWRNPKLSGWVQVSPACGDGVAVAALGFEANRIHGGIQVVDLHTGALQHAIKARYRRCNVHPLPEGADPTEDLAGWRDATDGDEDGEPTDWLVTASTHAVLIGNRILAARGRQHLDDGWHDADQPWTSIEVTAFDLASGAELWTYAPEPAEEGYAAGVAAAGDLVYLAALIGDSVAVHALDLTTGAPRWVRQLGTRTLVGPPALAGGLLYVADAGGLVTALGAGSGEVVWRFSVDDTIVEVTDLSEDYGDDYYPPASAVLPADGMLYVRARNALVALG